MSLSSDWSRAMVVRNEGNQDVLVVPSLTDNHNSAKVYAAAGNPIILRKRDPAIFTAVASNYDVTNNNNNDVYLGNNFVEANSANGVCVNTNYSNNSVSTGEYNLWSKIVGKQISQTFWIPDSSKNEIGLLETLHRRGPNNNTHILLQSRPLAELQFNYSTCTGLNIDLSHNAFRLSKTAMALQHVDQTLNESEAAASAASPYNVQMANNMSNGDTNKNDYDDELYENVNYNNNYDKRKKHSRRHHSRTTPSSSMKNIIIPTSQFKSTLRASLQSIQEEDYYLVKYRDYSEWAVNTYHTLAQSDSFFDRRKYVEQCFVVHVGREPGELIPITEAQFIFGVDILQRQLLNQLTKPNNSTIMMHGTNINTHSYLQFELDINYSALNSDQFRSLWVLLGEGLREVNVEGEELRQRQAAEAATRKETEREIEMRVMKERELLAQKVASSSSGFYDPYYCAPAWYDWTPSAIKKRIQHRLSRYYLSVGRLMVQMMVLGVAGYVCYRALEPYLPSLHFVHHNDHSPYSSSSSSSRGVPHSNRRPGREGVRRASTSGNYGRNEYYYEDNDYGDGEGGFRPQRGLFRSIFMGPKAVFDYMLAPDKV